MLRRHMATKKKDMPKDLDSGTPALDDDDLVDDDPEVDDLEIGRASCRERVW